ncbi:hypothetical protein E2C01_036555 [Portunus trituberculatus]|uniref:Uncharacterized protein n=1 Tax=Portunus trituberculatus TaxID=210409 RepID=A0A5B7F906_PORTR|nr:hypothetical protein [Portunus trituberculatus]
MEWGGVVSGVAVSEVGVMRVLVVGRRHGGGYRWFGRVAAAAVVVSVIVTGSYHSHVCLTTGFLIISVLLSSRSCSSSCLQFFMVVALVPSHDLTVFYHSAAVPSSLSWVFHCTA